MPDNIILNKAATIERCVLRIREEYGSNPLNLTTNFTKQDSILLNLQRACEASIDLAMHLVRIHDLGIPQDSRDAFDLLVKASQLPSELGEAMKHMVGFRNVAVHDYQTLNLGIVQAIIERHLDELLAFSSCALGQAQ